MRIPVRLVVLCLFSSALMACLTACYLFGNSSLTSTPPHTPLPKGTMNYAVADTYNNRVLIYNIPFSTDESASVVLGQPAFNNNSVNQGGGITPAANGLWHPASVAVDSSGNLYVADAFNCRVLQFKPPFTNNMNASVVIGEPNMTTATCTSGASTLGEASALTFDGDGDLWVADFGNNRIVEFVPPFSNGMSATIVLGQVDFTHGAINQGLGAPTASTLYQPWGMTFDSSGNLWVADSYNHRVLEYKQPLSNDMAASLELGQPAGATAFTTNAPNNGGISATSLYWPVQPVLDGDGNLWVSDYGNNRVLEYTPPFSNDMAATLELGQLSGATAFTTNATSTTQSGLSELYAISFDSSGNIQVVDSSNSRVMIFEPPFSNGMNATTVFGQANFTTGTANQGGIGANTLNNPWGGVTF